MDKITRVTNIFLKKELILIAEDNDLHFYLTNAIVRAEGYRTIRAHNGSDAVELFKRKKFDIILMDIRMPYMDGHESVRKIRELEGPKERIPIIAVTADAFEDDKIECMKAGCDLYVCKPLKRKDLVNKIAELV